MPQTLSEIRGLLEAHGLRPKKRFGQNFLIDANHLRKIVEAADVRPGEVILEVGPGTGTLTRELLAAGAAVVAVELDQELEPILRDVLAEFADRVELIFSDALANKHTINPAVMAAVEAAMARQGSSTFKLVANLPYQAATPVLANLATDEARMTKAVVMVQKEVAERLEAEPGGKEYGPVGVVVQAMYQVRTVSTLSVGCFWPEPGVASAVVELTRRQSPLTDDPAGLAVGLGVLFGQRRKQIGSILRKYGKDRAIHVQLPPGVSETQRPEELSVGKLIELVRAMTAA
ncbi:MAG: ribosomal RNA small subunit methyltransferase A [Phycisphaeraceae bacterium]|nr:ribosomal RNA small subunit methyltransferase A [Phycisphaeraceae bacterium]